MAIRQLTKIAVKDDRVTIHYREGDSTACAKEDFDTVQIESRRAPTSEFLGALDDLRVHLLAICELPVDDVEKTVVSGVSLSWTPNSREAGDFILGATMVGQRKLARSSAPLNLITPHKFERFPSGGDEGDENQLLTEQALYRVECLLRQAEAYLDGASAPSAQGSLFDRTPEQIAEAMQGLGDLAALGGKLGQSAEITQKLLTGTEGELLAWYMESRRMQAPRITLVIQQAILERFPGLAARIAGLGEQTARAFEEAAHA